jgi:iron complex transport system permease protein
MTRFSLRQFALTLLASGAFWAVVAGLCLLGGSGKFGWPEGRYVLHVRAQSVLLASLIGAALAVAGVAYQAILKNPLADPYLLGVSSGASLAGYLWRLPAGVAVGSFASAFSQQAFALLGALATIGVVFTLASRRGRLEPVTLLLVGVIVNAVNGSIFLFVNAIRPELAGQGGGMLAFLVGGIQTNYDPRQVAVAAVACAILFVVLLWLAPQLNVAGLSESEARSLGVRVQRLRWTALFAASLMTALAVALSGPIGFVGLVCPHVARRLVGHDARRLLPLSAALGAVLLALADTLSRVLIKDLRTWLPVGVLTGLIGGPFFLYLLYRQRNATTEEQARP